MEKGFEEGDTSALGFHGRFDGLNEPASTRLLRYFEQCELLNRMQPTQVRLARVARNYLHLEGARARR